MTTALYRRYRPETFAEVIGQEHVTAPLMQALRSGRVNHAYLFSGPRGCGKTTSARILARTLNCHRNTPENPIDTPCGECPSCVELARGGPGSLDVVEIDAASHNGVDDARDLRERATFAPARDRYKIFVLDEAHMVTSHGFNALLKIVEEPPPHIKFVFATTEPDKVIGTIRSRTHHYPFRLVPPDVLGPYLDQLCTAEGVELGAGVVPLVTRAGGGSVRDTLSVLDQLIAGAAGSVEYDAAVALLGFTHATLLDDVVDAIAARDGGSIFRVVDHVIATGHEPRRFVEDVLERLRDLIVIAVSGDAAGAVLRDLPADQLERMRHQAGNLGVAELSRAADLVNAALTEMTGATSPRLHLELLCARLLLPGADDGTDGLAARIDRLERGAVASGAVVPAGGAAPVAAGSAPTAQGSAGPAGPGGPTDLGGAANLTGPAAVRAALQQSRAARGATSASSAGSATAAPAPADAAPADAAPALPAPAVQEVSAPTVSAPTVSAPTVSAPASSAPAEAAPSPAPSPATGQESTAPVAPSAAVDDGAADDGAVDEGATDDGAVDEGAVDEGATDDRAASASSVASAPTAPAATAAEQPGIEQPGIEQPAETQAAPGAGGVTAEEVRRRWDEVVANLGSPVTRALVSDNAQVASLTGDRVVLAFRTEGLARNFSQPRHLESFAESLYQTLGVRAQVDVTVGVEGPGDPAGVQGGRERSDGPPASRSEPDDEPDDPDLGDPGPDTAPTGPPGPTGRAASGADRAATATPSFSGQDPSVNPAGSPGTAVPPVDRAPGEREAAAASAMSAADAADAAWLAGEPSSTASGSTAADAPSSGGGPDPARPDPAAALASARTAPGVPAASSVAQPTTDQNQAAGNEGTQPGTSDPGQAAPSQPRAAPSPRQAAEDAARQAQRFGGRPAPPAPLPPSAPAGAATTDYDDVSDDDPDITSVGLVGVPLVVKVLDGTVVEEVTDQP
ncbi:DNA polymerase III subunit gamma and tau [Isoptericola jiangsuensis]|uniref:DNA polymerase III subunit gamma and tau n=1 Tax=Isoptericola jiangsuensis TaxID=548579 RepID=UPI003AAB7BD6